MGKASKWFRGLLGLKKPDPSSQPPQPQTNSSAKTKTTKKKWSFVKSYGEKDQHRPHVPVVVSDEVDPTEHAIAVAAATAAVAEAAVAAAQAAAEVVRLTSSGRSVPSNINAAAVNYANARVMSFPSGNVSAASPPANAGVNGGSHGYREEWAAVIIQSHFRAYLSRRALRALKALVKLQAIVRGRIVRKRDQNAYILRQLWELRRSHTLSSVGRVGIFDSPQKGPATPEKFEHLARARSMHGENLMYRRNGSKNRSGSNQSGRVVFKSWETEGANVRPVSKFDETHDKILEIDSGKPQIAAKRRNLFHSSHLSIGSDQYSYSFSTSKDSTAHQTLPSLSSFEAQSGVSPMKYFYVDEEEDPFCTAESSPQLHSTPLKGDHLRRGPFTPTRSDGSRSCLSGYSDCPSYMSCTESSKAKMRSLSAPRQRPQQYERSSSTKRFSLHGYGETRVNPQRVATLQANFTSKAYPGSGRLDSLGMPMREEAVGFSGSLWHRY